MTFALDTQYLTQLDGAGGLQWRATVSRLLVGVQEAGHAENFHGDLRCRTVHGVRFADVRATPAHWSSAAEEGARPAYIVCVQLTGAGAIRQDGRVAELIPGDVAFYTTARESEASFHDDFHAVSLRIPIDRVGIAPSRIDTLTATVFPRGGLGAVMAGYLERMGSLLDGGTDPDRRQAVQAGVELFTAMVRSTDSAGLDPVHSELANSMIDHIELHLPEPALTPASVADALHISVRQLHKAFPEGDTVAAYIRRRRLAMCERDLADPALLHVAVAQIARKWGFANPSHFGELFRLSTGMSPAAYRRT